MSQPYQVVQAYDRALIKEIPADDAAALEAKLEAAFRLMKDRDGALKPYRAQRDPDPRRRTAGRAAGDFCPAHAREGGKALTDARIEAIRAVDGLRNAAEEIRNFAGREIPMGLTPANSRLQSCQQPRARAHYKQTLRHSQRLPALDATGGRSTHQRDPLVKPARFGHQQIRGKGSSSSSSIIRSPPSSVSSMSCGSPGLQRCQSPPHRRRPAERARRRAPRPHPRADNGHDPTFAGEEQRIVAEYLAHAAHRIADRNGGFATAARSSPRMRDLVRHGGQPAARRVAHEAQAGQSQQRLRQRQDAGAVGTQVAASPNCSRASSTAVP